MKFRTFWERHPKVSETSMSSITKKRRLNTSLGTTTSGFRTMTPIHSNKRWTGPTKQASQAHLFGPQTLVSNSGAYLAPSPIYEGYLLETKDDYQATAHASLTGKSVSAIHTGISIKAKKDLTATISDFDASLGKNCYKRSDAATYCRKGDVRVGYDKAGRKVR